MLKWFKREASARSASAGSGPRAGRRAFFKAGAGAVVGGAALAAGERRAEAAVLDEGAAGYRETDHVRRYYDSARM